MIKRILAGLMFFCTSSIWACPNAMPTEHPSFCPSFKTAASCYCAASGIPAAKCQNMKALYERMIAFYKSLDNACSHQSYTTVQDCINNWNCYRGIGLDSQGRECRPCE